MTLIVGYLVQNTESVNPDTCLLLDGKDQPVAFMGVQEDSLEMLFVKDRVRGKGMGRYLVNYAITELNIRKVDVNEQNRQAVGFYERRVL